ncbi:hydrogenase maturation nickel metallochaperone HypA [Candidatus Margulisiibacteriota bacterium]
MHNIVIAKDILRKLLGMIGPDQKPKRISIKIGEMVIVGHDPSDVHSVFSDIAKGTPLESTKLDIEIVKMRAICEDCGKEYEFGDQVFECSKCGGAEFKVDTGEEMVIEKIE